MKVYEKLRSRSPDVVAGSLIVLTGAFLPWGRSGSIDRSSFELVRLARRLDVLDGAAATGARLWLAAPLLVAAVVVAALAGRGTLAVGLGTLVAAAGVGLAIAVHQSPLVPRPGLHVTMGGAAVTAAGGLLRAVPLARARRPRPTAPRSEGTG
jgi:hypothetical protein